MLLLAFVSLALAQCVHQSDALEAVVFVKTTYTKGMVEAFKNVPGVTNVYYAKSLFLFMDGDKGKELKDEWNYVVLGKDLKDTAAQDEVITGVGKLSFVANYAGYRLKTNPHGDAATLNAIMKKADPAHFVKRPMKPQFPKPDCARMHLGKGDKMKLIQLQVINNGEMAERMGREMILRLFPSLKAQYDYIGGVEKSECSGIPHIWQSFIVMDFVDNDTWCEYTQSQWAK